MKQAVATIFALMLASLNFSSCRRDDIPAGIRGIPKLFLSVAEDENDLHDALFLYLDSAHFRFSYKPLEVKEGLVKVVVQLMGNATDYDRVIQLEVDDAGSTALPEEYEFPDRILLPAGQFTVDVPIVIKRSQRLVDRDVCLRVKLIPTTEFQINDSKSMVPGELTSFRIYWSDILPKPAWWVTSVFELGKYSRSKHRFMLDELAISPASFDTVYVVNEAGQIITVKDNALNSTIRNAHIFLNPRLDLYKQNNGGEPLRNEAGEEIRFCATCN